MWWKECYAQLFKTGHWMSRSDAKKGCRDTSKLAIENETGVYNPMAEKALEPFQLPIFRVGKASVPLYKPHNKTRDCTHFCEGDFGPMDHDNGVFGSRLRYGMGLPGLADGRNEANSFQIQQRWDLLMEHPTNSLTAKLGVCANLGDTGRGHLWDVAGDGPIPLVLQQCLERTEKVRRMLQEVETSEKQSIVVSSE